MIEERDGTIRAHLTTELPEVVIEPRVTIVRCGDAVVEIMEHGRAGSGDWAAWVGGHVIGNGGKVGYSYEQALSDAKRQVQKDARSGLLFAALREALGDK